MGRSHAQINARRKATGSPIISREAKADLRRQAGVNVRKSIDPMVDLEGYEVEQRAAVSQDQDFMPAAAAVYIDPEARFDD